MNFTLILAEVITFVVILAVVVPIGLYLRPRMREKWQRDGGHPWWPFVRSSSAVEKLDRRYAKGEITREEYLKTRNDMTGNRDA